LLVWGGEVRQALGPLIGLWLGSTAVFVLFAVHTLRRRVIQPLQRLTAEADALAARDLSRMEPNYGSAELDQLAARYLAMAEELLDVQSHALRVEKLAGIGRLAAGVAHEVRNPLGALSNYDEVLQRRGTDPAVTVGMRSAMERIDRIVQGLVDYARPGVAPAEAASGADAITDLNGAVRTVLDFLEAQGMLRSHGVELALDDGIAPVRGDRHLLEQVIVNLVTNACQAAPGGRVVVGTAAARLQRRASGASWQIDGVRTGMQGPGAMLFVADDGPGVPEADRNRVFDPFFTTKAPGDGSGLGLAIVARTVHESGGAVWVDQAREGGAVFKVFLPLAGETDASADR
ncbi:MAG: sensor histidine kinase, partial [Gemmatimonadales bacterium]